MEQLKKQIFQGLLLYALQQCSFIMRKILLGFLLAILTISCVKQDDRVVNITVEELKTILEEDKNVQLLDVRSSFEADGGVIFDAMQVNLISNDFEAKTVESFDKTKPVYVYCRSGGRSKIASSVLVDNGFKVFNVKGGYQEWVKKNKENE